MKAGHRLIGLDLLRPWLTANFLAFTVGAGIAGGLVRFLEQPYYETGVSAIDAAYIQASSLSVSGAIFGAVLGTMQWLVLRRAFRAGWWMPATCLGYALAGAITGFLAGGDVSTIGPDEGPVPPVVATLVGYPLTICVLGGFQWLVLRRDVDRAAWWALGNLVGLFAGFGLSFAAVTSLGNVLPLLQPTDYPSAKAFVLIGVVAGVVYGAVTWSALGQLRHRAAPDTSATPSRSAMASTDG